MSKSHSFRRAALSIALLTVGIVGWFALGTPQVPTRPPDRPEAPIVRTVTAEPHNDGITFEVDGVVVPFRQVALASQVSGKIEYKSPNCRIGRSVARGEQLIRVDPRDYQLEVARLVEEQKQAAAAIQELELQSTTTENQIKLLREQVEIDQRQLKRNEELLATRSASETELDQARRVLLTTQTTLQSLTDQLKLQRQQQIRLQSAKALVETNLEMAKLALSRTEIIAPIDGIVVTESVEQDGYVQAGSDIVTLQDTSQLDVACKLHMRQMNWLWQSQTEKPKPATVETGIASPEPGETKTAVVAAYDFPPAPATVRYTIGETTYQWQGVVDRYDGPGVDNQTRMVPCRVHVADPLSVQIVDNADSSSAVGRSDSARAERLQSPSMPPTLMTGMFVKVRIEASPPISLVQIPQEAIQPGNHIWTVVDGNLRRKLAAIATSDDATVIAYEEPGGLQAGDRVVISPLSAAIDGLRVRPVGVNDSLETVTRPVASGGQQASSPQGSPVNGSRASDGRSRSQTR